VRRANSAAYERPVSAGSAKRFGGTATGGGRADRTVDAPAVNDSLLGHAVFAEARSVLNDMFYLVTKRLRACDRNLAPAVANGKPYWKFPDSAKRGSVGRGVIRDAPTRTRRRRTDIILG
jgi:hypothetical protein